MKYYIIILVIVISFSCKKEDSLPETTYEYVSTELKSKFLFHKDSYWLFENHKSGIDSITLVNVETGFTQPCPHNGCPRNEFFTLTYQNQTQNISYNHYYYSNFIRYNGGGNWGENGQPIYLLNRNTGYEFNGLLVGEKYDSLEVSSLFYYNVEKFTIIAKDQYQNEFDFDTDLFFSPHIGIIRMVINDTINGPETWDLIRYKIE